LKVREGKKKKRKKRKRKGKEKKKARIDFSYLAYTQLGRGKRAEKGEDALTVVEGIACSTSLMKRRERKRGEKIGRGDAFWESPSVSLPSRESDLLGVEMQGEKGEKRERRGRRGRVCRCLDINSAAG